MIKALLEELEKCLIKAGNPIINYLDSGKPLDPAYFDLVLNLFKLEIPDELRTLYNWKTGIKQNRAESPEFNHKLFYFGSLVESSYAIELLQILCMRNSRVPEYRFLPLFVRPVLGMSAPILLNLSKHSPTCGMLLYESPGTGIPDPVTIYDSLKSMLETIITCYRQGIYTLSDQGILQSNKEEEVKTSSLLNPSSYFWKHFF